MSVVCRVCKGTGQMRALVCVGGAQGGASVATVVPCAECGATGAGGMRDWTPEQVAEAIRAATVKPGSVAR